MGITEGKKEIQISKRHNKGDIIMICPNCQNDVQDGARFCTKCGAPIVYSEIPDVQIEPEPTTEKPSSDNQPIPPEGLISEPNKKPEKKKSRAPIWIIAGSLVVIAAVAVILLLTVFKKPKFILNDYIYILDAGWDGYGQVMVGVNEKLLRESCTGQYGEKKTIEANKAYTALNQLMLSGSLSKDNHLSNGITVTYDIEFDQSSFEKEYGLKIEFTPMEHKVYGLSPVTEYDVFEDLRIYVEGYSSKATIRVDDSDVQVPGLSFSWDKDEGLSNGDVITFTVKETAGRDLDDFIPYAYGYKLTRTAYEYTVQGLETLAVIDDLFAYLDITYSGYPIDAAPLMNALVSSDGLREAYPDLGLEYDIQYDGRIRNGKDITICLRKGWMGDPYTDETLIQYLNAEGYDYAGAATKTVTVSGLPELVFEASTVPEDIVAEIAQQTRTKLDELIENNFWLWRKSSPIESMEVIGFGIDYITALKSDELDELDGSLISLGTPNSLVIIYEIKAPADGETKTFYIYSKNAYVIKDPDGTIHVDGGLMTPFGLDEASLRNDAGAVMFYGFNSVQETIEFVMSYSNDGMNEYYFDTDISY